MRRRYHGWVELDVAEGSSARGVLFVDGQPYRFTAEPVVPRRRTIVEDDDGGGDSTFGGEPTISLGPRGGVCPTCGR